MAHNIDAATIEELKDLMGDGFSNLVETYLANAEKYMSAINEGFANGNSAQVEEAAHPLKSSSGNMGLMALSELAKQVESAATESKNGAEDLSASQELMDQLNRIYTQSCEAIKAV